MRFSLTAALMIFAGSLPPFVRQAGAQEPAAPSAVQAGPRFDEVEVTGRVTYEGGGAAKGATVSTQFWDTRWGVQVLKTISTTTDDDGKFIFAVHRDRVGSLSLLVVDKNPRLQQFMKSPFINKTKREYWKEIAIELEKAVELRASVYDPQGKRVKGAKIWLHYPSSVPSPETVEVNELGQASLWVPAGIIPEAAVAFLDGVGIDYELFRTPDDVNSPPKGEPAMSDPVVLRLAPLAEIPVKVIDEAGKPLAGASVYPSFRRPGRRELMIRGGQLPDWMLRKTDEKGVATILAPNDVDEPVSVSAKLRHYTPVERMGRRYSRRTNEPTGYLWNPSKPAPVTVVMQDVRTTMTALRGRIVDRAGKPVANASVSASGQGFAMPMPFHKASVYSDARGEFEIALAKNMFYVLLIETGDRQAAHKSFAIADAAASEPMVITVEPARKVTLRAIDAMTAQPSPNRQSQVSLTVFGQYQNRYAYGDESPKLGPTPWGLNPSIYVFRGDTDENGEIELYLPDGQYEAVSFDGNGGMNDEHRFYVRGEPMEIEFLANYGGMLPGFFTRGRIEKIPKIPFTGKIVDASGAPLEGAEVTVGPPITLWDIDYSKETTGSAGDFSVARDPCATFVQAVSKDGTLAGWARIPTHATEYTLKLAPAARVTGRLIDAKTKKPLAGRNMEAARGGRYWSTGASAKATTDEEGRFVLSPLAPSVHYKINLTRGNMADLKTYSSSTWAEIFLDAPGQLLDLKEIEIEVDGGE